MKKILFILLEIMLVFSLILSGCGTGTDQAAAPSEDKSEIPIGATVSLTGSNAMTGSDQKWAYEQAVADINAAGGVEVASKKRPIKLIFADDKSTPADAAAAMENLIKVNGVKLVLGTNNTPLTMSQITVAEKYKVFLATNTCWLDALSGQNFKWTSDIFFTTTTAGEVPFQIWDSQPETERPKRIAIMMMDNSDGQGYAKIIIDIAKKKGYNIVMNESFTPGAKDFSSSILKMKSNNVDAVLWLGAPTDSIMFVRQMKEQQFKPKFVMGWMGFWPNEFKDALGADSDYLIHDGFWSETLPYPGAAELGKKYRDAHNGKDSVSIGLPYATVQVLAKAIERAGSLDPDKVRDKVFGGDFSGTVLGDIKYDEKGLASIPSLALQWYHGERKSLADTSSWKLKWIPQ